jgi:hypothetical protein
VADSGLHGEWTAALRMGHLLVVCSPEGEKDWATTFKSIIAAAVTYNGCSLLGRLEQAPILKNSAFFKRLLDVYTPLHDVDNSRESDLPWCPGIDSGEVEGGGARGASSCARHSGIRLLCSQCKKTEHEGIIFNYTCIHFVLY